MLTSKALMVALCNSKYLQYKLHYPDS